MLNHIKKSEGKGRGEKKGREREKESLDSKKSNLLSLTERAAIGLSKHQTLGQKLQVLCSSVTDCFTNGGAEAQGAPMPGAELHRAFSTHRGRSLAAPQTQAVSTVTPGPPGSLSLTGASGNLLAERCRPVSLPHLFSHHHWGGNC